MREIWFGVHRQNKNENNIKTKQKQQKTSRDALQTSCASQHRTYACTYIHVHVHIDACIYLTHTASTVLSHTLKKLFSYQMSCANEKTYIHLYVSTHLHYYHL